jgi:aminopeptidase N
MTFSFRRIGFAATAAALAAATTVGLVGTAHAGEATPGAAGIGDPLFPALGNGGYDATAYEVSLDYRPGVTTMASSVIMHAVATQTMSQFDLDSVGQLIAGVSVNGKPARFALHDEELVVTPPSPLPAGHQFTVTVRYTADRSQEPASAAFPDVNLPGNHIKFHNWINTSDGFALLGQPDRAHLFFPCNDHPSDKAQFTFQITVPRGLAAIANGNLVARVEAGDHSTFTYRTAQPMATQLSQIAVGAFAFVTQHAPDGPVLRSAVPADRVAALRPALDRTASQVTWLRNQLGRAFPFDKYGVLAVDHNYNGVALETQGLSTFSAEELALPERNSAPVQMHELVHQYFGDAVSVRTFSDIWLSEGHAYYYQSRYSAGRGWTSFETAMRQEYEADAESRQAEGPPAAPKKAINVFGSESYTGGGLALYAFEQTVGAQTFRDVERTFLDRYQCRSASTEDYINVANEVTGRDLTGLFRAWLYGATTPPMAGHPDWKPAPTGS